MTPITRKLSSLILKTPKLNPTSTATATVFLRQFSTNKSGEDEWNDAWESAWLPDNLTGKTRAPWETDVNFSLTGNSDHSNNSNSPPQAAVIPSDIDSETKAFVEDMTENWEQRKGKANLIKRNVEEEDEKNQMITGTKSLYKLDSMKKDYRLKKQRVHAGLWTKEIEKMEEAKLGDSFLAGDNIDKLLDSCSEIFDSPNNVLSNTEISSSELKNKPDGWETTAKTQDGNIWEMSQREEDILLQEFERRIAFNKFQIASFIKTHIFSRRRPIDGWRHMIEEIGPNARKGNGSVSRIPSLADEATQPFREEKLPIASSPPSYRARDEKLPIPGSPSSYRGRDEKLPIRGSPSYRGR